MSDQTIKIINRHRNIKLGHIGKRGRIGETGSSIITAEFDGDDIKFTKDDSTIVILEDGKKDLKGDKGDTGDIGDTGDTGASITSAEFDSDNIKFTKDDSQTVILANAKIELKGDEGRSALDGFRELTGNPEATELDMFIALIGERGDNGVGISFIGKTAINGLIDTYTITYTDGSTSMFDITNGSGISDITKIGTIDLIDTYKINCTNGSYATFSVTNGEKGDTGSTIESAEFSGDDIIFTKDDSTTVTLANAKTELKGDRGIDADILKITSQTKLSGYVQSSTMENSVVYNYLRDDDNIIIGVNKV